MKREKEALKISLKKSTLIQGFCKLLFVTWFCFLSFIGLSQVQFIHQPEIDLLDTNMWQAFKSGRQITSRLIFNGKYQNDTLKNESLKYDVAFYRDKDSVSLKVINEYKIVDYLHSKEKNDSIFIYMPLSIMQFILKDGAYLRSYNQTFFVLFNGSDLPENFDFNEISFRTPIFKNGVMKKKFSGMNSELLEKKYVTKRKISVQDIENIQEKLQVNILQFDIVGIEITSSFEGSPQSIYYLYRDKRLEYKIMISNNFTTRIVTIVY